jgi:hypothetical protein
MLGAAQTSKVETFTTWRQSAYTESNDTVARTEQLVCLAKQSLAASMTRKSDTANLKHAANGFVKQDKQEDPTNAKILRPTRAWDGPTIWAHLW